MKPIAHLPFLLFLTAFALIGIAVNLLAVPAPASSRGARDGEEAPHPATEGDQ